MLRHAGSVLLIPYTKETLDVLLLDPHSMLIQNCIVAIIPIGSHTMLPLWSIRKTSFQASLVKSPALHTTCVFNPIFIVRSWWGLLFTDCQEVGLVFPGTASSWNPGRWVLNSDLVSKGSPPLPLPCRTGHPWVVCSAELPTFTFRAGTVPPRAQPREEPPALPPRGRISATAPQLVGTQLLTRTR